MFGRDDRMTKPITSPVSRPIGTETGRAPAQTQPAQILLGGVGDRREIVGGEDGETGALPEPLVMGLSGGDGPADEPPLERGQVHRRWDGTSTTTIPLRKSSPPLMSSAGA